jgi:hypothetical protein
VEGEEPEGLFHNPVSADLFDNPTGLSNKPAIGVFHKMLRFLWANGRLLTIIIMVNYI